MTIGHGFPFLWEDPIIRLLRIAAIGAAIALTSALVSVTATKAAPAFPQYSHVFLILDENLSYSQVIGSPDAPEINALAADYGLATHYTGVGDPSEPNYVGMLGGSTFGISDDNPYFWPGHTVNQPNLMSQLEAAGMTWKAYLQGIPYAGYRGYCYPAKCLGIPDADALYRAKHNGIVNFADMQTPAEFAKQVPYTQFATDLASGNVPNFSYIIPDECHDIHGAPPFCTDSDKAGSVDQNWLIATGDGVVGNLVGEITSSSLWQSGSNAIMLTSDEGNNPNQTVATVVITSHGPRGVKDNTGYDHYSLLASLEAAFGLGCLQNSCSATPMTPLFQVTGSTTVPALPAPFVPPPNGNNSISPMGGPVKGTKTSLSCSSGWQQVPSPSIGSLDNNLAAVSAASASDAWAVGDYYTAANPKGGNILYGISALSDTDAWAVGVQLDANGGTHPLTEHWDGTSWTVVPAVDPNGGGNALYALDAVSSGSVYAVGQTGAAFPSQALVEHWNGSGWSQLASPADAAESLTTLGVTGSDAALTLVGDRESDTAPYTTEAATGAPSRLSLVTSPNNGAGENDLFGVTTASDGTIYAAGWYADPSSGNYFSLIEHETGGVWSIDSSPNPGTGSNGFAGITAIPGGGLWAVGNYSNSGNNATLIAHHC